MKRYRKSRSGVLIRLIQPAVWIIVIGNTFAGTRPLIQSVGFNGSYIEFMAPGVIMLTAIFTSIFGGVNTLWDRRYGFMNCTCTWCWNSKLFDDYSNHVNCDCIFTWILRNFCRCCSYCKITRNLLGCDKFSWNATFYA